MLHHLGQFFGGFFGFLPIVFHRYRIVPEPGDDDMPRMRD